MIKTVDKTNTSAPDGTFPYGNIKDDDGSFNGTPLNKELFSDYVQFFERMFAESGLTANGSLDDANTNQLWEALLSISPILRGDPIKKYNDFSSLNTLEFPTGVFSFGPQATINEFDLSTGFPGFSPQLTTFSNALPLGTELTFITRTGSQPLPIVLNSTLMTSGEPIITMEGVSGSNTAFSMVAEKLYKVIRLNDGWRIKEL